MRLSMEFKITQTEYDKIEYLARCAISAYSKNDAKSYLTQLESAANSDGYAGSVRNIISELCSSVSNAAGNAADKSKRIHFVEMDLYKLKDFIEG
jgi:hypothetical protein